MELWSTRLLVGGLVWHCVFALWRGRMPERLVATGILIGQAVGLLTYKVDHTQRIQWPLFAADVVFLALLVAVAVRFRRPWVYLACAFQVLAFGTYAALLLDPRISTYTGRLNSDIWMTGILLCLFWGAVTARPWSRNASSPDQKAEDSSWSAFATGFLMICLSAAVVIFVAGINWFKR